MRRTRILMLAGVIATVGMLTACSGEQSEHTAAPSKETVQSGAETETEQESTAEATSEPAVESTKETTAESAEAENGEAQVLEEIMGLLGMEDAETAELFGGGEENRTESQIYIGRIYQAQIGDNTYPVYTSCDKQNIVTAVSVSLSGEEQEVSEEEIEKWVQLLTEITGSEPSYNDTESEGGSKNWKWTVDGKMIALRKLENLLSINMNLMVGELK